MYILVEDLIININNIVYRGATKDFKIEIKITNFF